MTDFFTYITKEGQRWDAIAYEVYGDQFLWPGIVRANPQYLGVDVLEGAIALQVPVIESTVLDETINPDDLPPWKR